MPVLVEACPALGSSCWGLPSLPAHLPFPQDLCVARVARPALQGPLLEPRIRIQPIFSHPQSWPLET